MKELRTPVAPHPSLCASLVSCFFFFSVNVKRLRGRQDAADQTWWCSQGHTSKWNNLLLVKVFVFHFKHLFIFYFTSLNSLYILIIDWAASPPVGAPPSSAPPCARCCLRGCACCLVSCNWRPELWRCRASLSDRGNTASPSVDVLLALSLVSRCM